MMGMKKNKLYRLGACVLAGILVFTSVPQTFSLAEETQKTDNEMASLTEMQETDPLTEEDESFTDGITLSDGLSDEDGSSQDGSGQPDGAASSQSGDGQPNGDGSSQDGSDRPDANLQAVDPQEDETPDPPEIPVTGIKLNYNELTLERNTTKKLEVATWTPANCNQGKTVKFESSDTDIATVDPSSGVITAVKVPENGLPVTITAKAGVYEEVIDTCKVTVTPIPVESVTLDQSTLELTAGDATGKLKVYVEKKTADNKAIRVESTSPNVATVEYKKNEAAGEDQDYDIIVKPLKRGTTEIRVISISNEDKYAKCKVNVNSAVVQLESLTLNPRKLTMTDDETLRFKVGYIPSGTTQKGVTCEVTEIKDFKGDTDSTGEVVKNTVTVNLNEDGDGTLKSTSLPVGVTKREVTVTAASTVAKKTVDGKEVPLSASFTVTITRMRVAAESLSVLTKELVLEDGGKNQTGVVEVKLSPTDSTDRTIKATVPDSQKHIAEVTESATVNASGNAKFTVKGLEPGTCQITFKAGNVEAVFPVTVNEYIAPIDSLELRDKDGKSASSLEIKELESETLTAVIMPLKAEDKRIKWSISDPEIATITGPDEDGSTTAQKINDELVSTVTINAHMVGECTVTATAAGEVSQKCKIKVIGDETNAVTGLTVNTDADSGLGSNPKTIYIRQGQTITLTPSVDPSGANQKVRWSSGGSDVVSLSVNENSICTVSADHTGTCTVTAQASSSAPECKKEIEIVVRKPRLEVKYPEDFSFEPDMQPITEDKLKEKLTVKFYAYETPALTENEIELPADQYRMEIVSENGVPRPYEPEDMEKAGTKVLVISYDYKGERIESPDRVLVVMKEFSEAVLEGVTPLSGNAAEVWNVPNGTPVSSLPLAETAEITVKGVKSEKTVKMDAEIRWNLKAIDYDVNSAEAQEFVVYGTINLPEYVKNNDSISLDVSATVHVREAAFSGKKVEAPKFSVLGGEKIGNTAVEVPYGSKIVVESSTEEAVIYYMMNQRPDAERGVPQDEEHRYKSPLEITEKTTTIYAIATKEGYTNSTCSECTVKLIKAEPDIPDDPDDPEPDQVIDTDRPATGKIPSGLWVAVQPDENGRKDDFPYTGSAIKPVIRVYNHTTLLKEKKDYTISYKNNTKAGEKGSANAPCIIVKGKGNFSGEARISFSIKPQSIEDDSVVMEEYAAVAYNKKEQKPNPSLIWNGKKLSKGKDFTVTDRVFKEPQKYDVTVTGIGNFTGTRKMTYEIFSGGVSVSKLKVSKIPDQKCTGEAITPPVVVKYKKTVLRENANYTVQYKNNIEVGTGSVIITGLGNYRGTKRVDFKIKPMANIKDVGFSMTFDPATPVYNGAPVKPVSYKAVYQSGELKEGVDYKVSYANNNKAGTASLILTGIGRFTGTAKKNYKIQSGDLGKIKSVELAAAYPYEKGGCKPKPKIVSGNYVLQEGKDYTLSYSKNNAVGNNASVTIKGKGSFKGEIVKKFAVTRQNIANLQVVAADKQYQNKSNKYRTSVKVIDVNGKALTAGKDYDKEMYYTYADGPKQGEQVLPTDLIPKGTNLRVEVRVSKPKNYIGTAYGIYRIVQADISKAKVKVDPQEYNGRKKKPGKDQIHVTLNGVLLGDDDYEIVEYKNNVNQGTAKVTIRGVGSYGGTKTANFKIQRRGLFDLIF